MTTIPLLYLIVLGLIFRVLWAKNKRNLAAEALARRADTEHQWVLSGDPRGIFGRLRSGRPARGI